MSTFKLTAARGQDAPVITKSAGSAIAGSDAIECNFDVTNMNKGEAFVLLDEIKRHLIEHGFPQ